MAKNKKKLRKKLRQELIQKNIAQSQTQTIQTKPIVESKVSSSQVNIQAPETTPIPSEDAIIDSHDQAKISIIKKDVRLVLVICLLIILAFSLGKYFDLKYNWVIDFSNWLFSIFTQ